MNEYDPIQLLFADMEKLGPGGDAHTMHILASLPQQRFRNVVDAGCGAGRQTLVLAKELQSTIHAVDSYAAFLEQLERRVKNTDLEQLVCCHCMDMQDIPGTFPVIDLLWSEGAAYNIGFGNALRTWAAAIEAGGFLVVSELSWLKQDAPQTVMDFFAMAYPEMQTVEKNREIAESSGYRVLGTHTLPDEAWVEGYYDILEPHARSLVSHPDSSVREFAEATIREIEIFECSEDSYGYVFYVLERNRDHTHSSSNV